MRSRWCAYLVLVLTFLSLPAPGQTGLPASGFEDVDAMAKANIASYRIPGISVAIVKDGRLLMARSYGLADVEAGQAFEPVSLNRWGSISKTVAASCIMKLVEQKKLDLDARVFDILKRVRPYNGVWGDARIPSITVRQLLHHTGGWDRAVSGDPIMSPIRDRAAALVGGPYLPSIETLTRYMIAQPLDFAPGTRFAYSNLGYLILGLVVEEVSGESYESFARKNVFDPIGVVDIGRARNLLEERLPGEVRYYDTPGAAPIASTLLPDHRLAPGPYALCDMNNSLPAGGWVGSVIHLAKLVTSLDGQRPPAVLAPESVEQMLATGTWIDDHSSYGFGIIVQFFGDLRVWTHSGAVPGARGTYVRFSNGLTYAFLFNGEGLGAETFRSMFAENLSAICLAPRAWPEHDLFFHYFAPRIAESGVVSAASFQAGPVAADSLVTIFGSDLGGGTGAEVSARIKDSAGTEHPVDVLYASTAQMNVRVPAGVAPGPARLIVSRKPHADVSAPIQIAAVSPGLFMLNADKLTAAVVTRVRADGSQAIEMPFTQNAGGAIVAKPIRLGESNESVYLSLYGTGIRGGSGLSGVAVEFDGVRVPVTFAGPHPVYAGLDQVNVRVERSLVHSGSVAVSLVADGVRGNQTVLTFE